MRKLILLILFPFLAGCANGYQQFYQSEISGTYAPTKEVRIYKFTQNDLQTLLNSGYIVIGQSNFNGPLQDQSLAISQAKKVGADVVLIDYQSTGTVQGVAPIVQYHPGQTTTVQSFGHASGSIYGPGGSVYGSATGVGTSFIRTPGYTTTQYVPYAVERYDQRAVFLRKLIEGESEVSKNTNTVCPNNYQHENNYFTTPATKAMEMPVVKCPKGHYFLYEEDKEEVYCEYCERKYNIKECFLTTMKDAVK